MEEKEVILTQEGYDKIERIAIIMEEKEVQLKLMHQ